MQPKEPAKPKDTPARADDFRDLFSKFDLYEGRGHLVEEVITLLQLEDRQCNYKDLLECTSQQMLVQAGIPEGPIARRVWLALSKYQKEQAVAAEEVQPQPVAKRSGGSSSSANPHLQRATQEELLKIEHYIKASGMKLGVNKWNEYTPEVGARMQACHAL